MSVRDPTASPPERVQALNLVLRENPRSKYRRRPERHGLLGERAFPPASAFPVA